MEHNLSLSATDDSKIVLDFTAWSIKKDQQYFNRMLLRQLETGRESPSGKNAVGKNFMPRGYDFFFSGPSVVCHLQFTLNKDSDATVTVVSFDPGNSIPEPIPTSVFTAIMRQELIANGTLTEGQEYVTVDKFNLATVQIGARKNTCGKERGKLGNPRML
jgi:hypothetical protein